MSRAVIGKRLADLEQRASNVRQECIVCTPMPDNLLAGAVQLAPGVFTSRYHYPNRHMTRSILYTDLDLLKAWLDEAGQRDDRKTIYTITTQAQFDAVKARIEEDI